MNNQKGFIGVFLVWVAIMVVVIAIPVILLTCMRWEWSEDNVSGVVYNASNNTIISGNTTFSVRAAVDTYVSSENRSSYCLPPDSEYIGLVNEAARDKNIIVQVTTKRGFWWKMPWTCINNITVVRVK